jgi:Zn-dependent protease with chaperone function
VDFFAAQDRSLRKSRWWMFCFVMAVMSIVTLVYLSVVLFANFQELDVPLWNAELFFSISLLVGGGIALASLFKAWQISRHGGALIAEQLGGRMVTRETSDPAERRLLNVIDEMAIAAGIPAPVAYVLDEEPGLNAFAAGLSTRDCVVGVTRGLLETMNRDELQGVIGHEISHIVNGDSRLNLKLIGVLFGIYALTLVGRLLMRARGKNAAPAVMMGLALCVIGFAGVFFGRIIQAAVSREREYLADASAVQFTRHPPGLASALGKLRSSSSQVQHPRAAAASHLFFGASVSSLFATHPPLDERIRRVGGESVQLPEVRQPSEKATLQSSIIPNASPIAALAGSSLTSGEPLSANIAQAQSLLANLPETLRQQAQCATGAVGIVGGLLFSERYDIRLEQEKQLPPAALPVARELYQWLFSQPEQGARFRLVWLDLVLPVLREASEAGRQQLLILATALIRADGRVSPSEFALYSLLRDSLLPSSERRVKRSDLSAKQLDQDVANLLALITWAGHEDAETARAAYQAAMASSPAGASHPFPEKSALSLTATSQALAHLALAAPLYRKKVLHACTVAVHFDGKVTAVENELLRAFTQSLDCPAPLMEG